MNNQTTSLVIADDHYAIWDAVIGWLTRAGSFKVLAQVGDGIQALQACVNLKPDVLLLDISMPVLNGLQVITGLKKTSLPVRILIYTADDSPEMAFETISEGALGYVVKSSPRQILLKALETIVQNKTFIDPSIEVKVANYLNAQGTHKAASFNEAAVLTEREIEIMQLLVLGSGKSTDIADILCVSRYTVNNHISSIYRKLGVNTRTEAIRKSRLLGIIEG